MQASCVGLFVCHPPLARPVARKCYRGALPQEILGWGRGWRDRRSRARRGGAEGCGLGKGAVAPPQHGSGKAPENFSRISVEIAYFSEFFQAEMVSSVAASRQD